MTPSTTKRAKPTQRAKPSPKPTLIPRDSRDSTDFGHGLDNDETALRNAETTSPIQENPLPLTADDPVVAALDRHAPTDRANILFPHDFSGQKPRETWQRVLERVVWRDERGRTVRSMLYLRAVRRLLRDPPELLTQLPEAINEPPWAIVVVEDDRNFRDSVLSALEESWPGPGHRRDRLALLGCEKPEQGYVEVTTLVEQRIVLLTDQHFANLSPKERRESGHQDLTRPLVAGMDLLEHVKGQSIPNLTSVLFSGMRDDREYFRGWHDQLYDNLFLKAGHADPARYFARMIWTFLLYDEAADAFDTIAQSVLPGELEQPARKAADLLLRGELRDEDTERKAAREGLIAALDEALDAVVSDFATRRPPEVSP